MGGKADECILCRPHIADAHFPRLRVWQDERWRLSVVLAGPIAGFAHLEPCRHIPSLAELDGPEALSLGRVLARTTRALRAATSAERTYVYVFGDHVDHLHFNLAPHRDGDGLRGGPGLLDPAAVDLDVSAHRAVALAAAHLLAESPRSDD